MLDKSKPYQEERTVAGASFYIQGGRKFGLDGVEIDTMLSVPVDLQTPFDVETADLEMLHAKAIEIGLKWDARWGLIRARNEVRQALSL